ncbi:MAG: hypothetical protein Kow0059_08810 [Candidatus Sumerlaeia bacterium]
MIEKPLNISSLDSLRSALETVAPGEDFAIEFADRLLAGAWALRASDVHLESRPAGLQVKVRLDGRLYAAGAAPAAFSGNIMARLKYMARLAVYQHTTPQDGRLTFETPEGIGVDLRVSFLPSVYGEKAVIRLPEPDQRDLNLESLGLPDAVCAALVGLARRRQGLLLLTGPSSSGKTTTIYALLKFLYGEYGEAVNIASIEDPVEQRLGFLCQTQVHPAQGLTFAEGLKSILRQDPDIIMVGETRDAETAVVAVHAALTGHLVLSTMHSASAPGVFLRLVHMGIEPFLVASAVQGVLAQRLVRRLCPSCRRQWPRSQWPEPIVARFSLGQDAVLYQAVGCEDCGATGYRGRTGLFSLLAMEPSLQDLILARASAAGLDAWTEQRRAPSLLDDGLAKARAGLTSLEEVLRCLGEETTGL